MGPVDGSDGPPQPYCPVDSILLSQNSIFDLFRVCLRLPELSTPAFVGVRQKILEVRGGGGRACVNAGRGGGVPRAMRPPPPPIPPLQGAAIAKEAAMTHITTMRAIHNMSTMILASVAELELSAEVGEPEL